MAAATRTRKRAKPTCKRCGEKMNNPSSHRNGCPIWADDESAVDLDNMGALVDAALDAVKAEMKDGRKKQQKVINLLKKAIEVLEG